MCGIVGFTGAKDTDTLKKMMNCIEHRGPDDGSFYDDDAFSIGYRRLSIVDLSKNIYPITNETDDIFLFQNGEIYNYVELRQKLEKKGHEFKTQSDSEVILHGYEEWGEDVVNHLRGMFVITIVDKRRNVLFISRDRLGIKPLYYTELNGRLIFSSEIKAIVSQYEVDRTPDDKSVYQFLMSRIHDTDKNTFFKNIKRLLPGHSMLVDRDSNYRIYKYWEPTFTTEFNSKKSDTEYAEEFKEIFSEAVDLHLIGDVPVGVTLSGGLDSSGITSLAKQLYDAQGHDTEIIAFSAIHPGETINEEEYIDSVVNHTGIKSVKIVPQVENFWNEVDNWFYYQEEPVISGAPYAYYTVMREARKQVTVLLSGQGGDELLAGYIPYFQTYIYSALDAGKPWAAIRESFQGRDLYMKFFAEKILSRFKRGFSISPRSSLKGYQEFDTFVPTNFRNLNERLFMDVTSLTTPCLLRYEDKNSMANSLESRVPFFDHKVVEYIFNLPIDQKIKHGWNRYIYRNAMKGVIPEVNRLRRSKVGFTNPEWEWIERKQDKFIEIFSSESFRSRKYWDADKVLYDFGQALSGKANGDILYFWRVFAVEMWMRSYVDVSPRLK